MSVGPTLETGHADETSLFIKGRRLKIITLHPDAPNATTRRLGHIGIQDGARVAPAAMVLINPQLLQFRCPGPGIARRHRNQTAINITDDEADPLRIIPTRSGSIVEVKTILHRVDFVRRQVVPRLNRECHAGNPVCIDESASAAIGIRLAK